ncbi:MAG: hypothetical protein ACOZNI_29565 [Myxococcota bacterium]
MSSSAPPEPDPRDNDHLRVLALGHFVGAGFATLMLLFCLFHYSTFGSTIERLPSPRREEFAAFFDSMTAFYLLMGGVCAIYAVANGASGWFLEQRRHRTFSLVVAAANFVHFPLGMALGVATIVVLLRPTVRDAYAWSKQVGQGVA